MNLKRLVLATLAVWVVGTALDFVIHGVLLEDFYAALSTLLRQDVSITWFIVGELAAALVFVWVYARVFNSFGGGAGAGASYGLYAAILITFPAQIFNHLLIVDFPYSLAWLWTGIGVLWGVVNGAVAGALYKP